MLLGPLLWKRERHRHEDETHHWQNEIKHRGPAMIIAEPAADAGTAENADHQGYRPNQVNMSVLWRR